MSETIDRAEAVREIEKADRLRESLRLQLAEIGSLRDRSKKEAERADLYRETAHKLTEAAEILRLSEAEAEILDHEIENMIERSREAAEAAIRLSEKAEAKAEAADRFRLSDRLREAEAEAEKAKAILYSNWRADLISRLESGSPLYVRDIDRERVPHEALSLITDHYEIEYMAESLGLSEAEADEIGSLFVEISEGDYGIILYSESGVPYTHSRIYDLDQYFNTYRYKQEKAAEAKAEAGRPPQADQ